MTADCGNQGGNPRPEGEQGDQPSMLMLSTLVYGVMAVVGLGLMVFAHGNLDPLLLRPIADRDTPEMGRLLLVAALGAGLLLILSYFFESWFRSFRDLRDVIMELLGASSWPMAIYLAVISAVGEELLFRGGLQPYLGIGITSVLFGLLHLGPNGRISTWSVWAFVAGVLFGWMVVETSSLWPALGAHFFVNAFSIMRLRWVFDKHQAVDDCSGVVQSPSKGRGGRSGKNEPSRGESKSPEQRGS